jgi:hypothetical protein
MLALLAAGMIGLIAAYVFSLWPVDDDAKTSG